MKKKPYVKPEMVLIQDDGTRVPLFSEQSHLEEKNQTPSDEKQEEE